MKIDEGSMLKAGEMQKWMKMDDDGIKRDACDFDKA